MTIKASPLFKDISSIFTYNYYILIAIYSQYLYINCEYKVVDTNEPYFAWLSHLGPLVKVELGSIVTLSVVIN